MCKLAILGGAGTSYYDDDDYFWATTTIFVFIVEMVLIVAGSIRRIVVIVVLVSTMVVMLIIVISCVAAFILPVCLSVVRFAFGEVPLSDLRVAVIVVLTQDLGQFSVHLLEQKLTLKWRGALNKTTILNILP